MTNKKLSTGSTYMIPQNKFAMKINYSIHSGKHLLTELLENQNSDSIFIHNGTFFIQPRQRYWVSL